MYSKLAVFVLMISTIHCRAQTVIEGEIAIGPTIATVGAGSATTTYGGVAIGASMNVHIIKFGVGTLGVSLPPMLVIGESFDDRGLDFQRLHIPLGIMLCVGDNQGYAKPSNVSGALTVGYGSMFSPFTRDGWDIRPFFNLDIAAGIFDRGSLKIRYSNVFGNYTLSDGRPVGYHGIYFIGSTEW